MSDHPNILLFITHDTGQRLGCYGNASVSTPNLDRLAAEGVRFENHFCTAPQCSPSRGSILTGRFPHVNGLMGLVNRGWHLPDSETTLAEHLGAAGYETLLFGFQHEKRDLRSLQRCYQWISDRSVPPLGENVAPEVTAFLRARNTRDRPFFAMVGLSETHRPFDRYAPVDPRSVEVPPFLPDLPEVRQDLAMLHGSIRAMDTAVGPMLDALDAAGMGEQTLTIYTTDHGIAFPRAKCTLYDPGIRTALLMRWPEGFQGGRALSPMLSNVDLLPTLLEIVGIRRSADLPIGADAGSETGATLDGRTFLPLLRGEPYEPREHVFAEKTWHDKYDPMRAIRTDRYKYIRNWEPGPLIEMPLDIQRSLSGQALQDAYNHPRPSEELYDLERDPGETINRAGEPVFAEAEAALRERLMEWLEVTHDPLLRGPVPPPTDA